METTLTKVWVNFYTAHCCFTVFELRVGYPHPFFTITLFAFIFPVKVEIEMNCCKDMPKSGGKEDP